MKLPEPHYVVTSDEKHRYTIKTAAGEIVGPLKSVTSILGIIAKPQLIPWAAREAAGYFKTEILRMGRGALDPAMLEQIAKDAAGAHRRKAKDAADLGTACHDAFEAIILGREPENLPPELIEPTLDFKRWRLTSDIEIIATEIAVASARHRYGGRIDAIGYSPSRGGFGIVDFKTSKSLKYGNEFSYQVGAYAGAASEQYGVKFSWAEIVRFGKTAPFDSESRPVIDIKTALDGFLYALELTRCSDIVLIGEPSFCTATIRAIKDISSCTEKTPNKLALGF